MSSLVSKQSELSFAALVEILSIEHDSKTVTELVKGYCLRSSSLDIQKKGMEFLYMNGYVTELRILIEKNSKSDHLSNRNWAAVYQTMLDRKMEVYPPHEIISRLERIETNEPELKCLIKIGKVSCYVDMRMFEELGNFLDVYEQWFEQVEDQAILSYLKIRHELIMMFYYFTRNLPILARRYALSLLHNAATCPYIKLVAHTQLGFSYLFESYFEAMNHMQQALKVAMENNYSNATYVLKNQNIPFIAAHFGQVENMKTENKSEQAHIELARGNNRKAIEILSDLPLNSPFELYYMGRAKQDRKLLIESAHHFIEKRSDYFFCRLPLNELNKLA